MLHEQPFGIPSDIKEYLQEDPMRQVVATMWHLLLHRNPPRFAAEILEKHFCFEGYAAHFEEGGDLEDLHRLWWKSFSGIWLSFDYESRSGKYQNAATVLLTLFEEMEELFQIAECAERASIPLGNRSLNLRQ